MLACFYSRTLLNYVNTMFFIKGKRFQEYSLKSPGIKPSTNRHGSSTKSNTLPSLPKMSEEEDSSHSACNTPTSPHKPQSPTATVFANSPGKIP